METASSGEVRNSVCETCGYRADEHPGCAFCLPARPWDLWSPPDHWNRQLALITCFDNLISNWGRKPKGHPGRRELEHRSHRPFTSFPERLLSAPESQKATADVRSTFREGTEAAEARIPEVPLRPAASHAADRCHHHAPRGAARPSRRAHREKWREGGLVRVRFTQTVDTEPCSFDGIVLSARGRRSRPRLLRRNSPRSAHLLPVRSRRSYRGHRRRSRSLRRNRKRNRRTGSAVRKFRLNYLIAILEWM